MINILSIAIGGALGSILRYGVQKLLNTSFPLGTLSVNIAGCFFYNRLDQDCMRFFDRMALGNITKKFE